MNLVENPKALGFHQEQTETMEDSTEIPGLVLYQALFYLLKKKILTTSFSYNTKIQIQGVILMCLDYY